MSTETKQIYYTGSNINDLGSHFWPVNATDDEMLSLLIDEGIENPKLIGDWDAAVKWTEQQKAK